MRSELEIIKVIEQYLRGELNEDDKKRFENQLDKSPELQKQVQKQKLIMEGVQNVGTKENIKKAKKTYTITKAAWYGVMVLVVAGVVTAGVIGYQKYFNKNNASENIKHQLNEEGTSQWTDADEMIAPQFFDIDMTNGDVVQTDQGMIIAIPEGAFLDKNGKTVTGMIELEVKEALDKASILTSGLSTKSGDDLLETGGMFYLNARKNGENLTLNKDNPIIVEVPTDEVLSDMELYKGVRKDDGTIDWQNPKKIEQFLIPVDIHTLNFYPPLYEPTIDKLGYAEKNKAWKDSVYYSFANTNNYSTQLDSTILSTWEINDVYNYTSVSIIDSIATTSASAIAAVEYLQLNPSKVQAIWNDQFQNTLIATKEFEERMLCLHGLAQDQFLDLYVNNLDKRISTIDSMLVKMIGGDDSINVDKGSTQIASINKTDSINCLPCESCDKEALKNQFIKFAQQNKGRVKLDLGAVKMLQNYYTKHAKIYGETAEKVQTKFLKEYNEELSQLSQAKNDKNVEDWNNYNTNLNKEINDNLDEVYKQLGMKRVKLPKSKYSVPIVNVGWHNIDRAVIEGTIARETINVELNGKKAQIKYEPITINVKESNKYEKVFVYLLPTQLTSYQRVTKQGDSYTEKLNEFYNYDLVAVGYIGEEIYVGIERGVSPKNYDISLHVTDKSDLNKVFHTVGKPKHRAGFVGDILDQQYILKKETNVNKMNDMIEFRDKVKNAIFQCSDIKNVESLNEKDDKENWNVIIKI